MPIVIPQPEMSDSREVAILDVVLMIESAITDDRPVNIYDLAEEIVDRVFPPKPRIRVRAATQRAA